MKVVFIYADGRRVYETIANIGDSPATFDMGDFMLKCQKHRGAVMCEPDNRPKHYIIKAFNTNEPAWPDYFRTINEGWTSVPMISLEGHSVEVYDSEDAAQAAIDELSEDMDMAVWTLSYEEYTE